MSAVATTARLVKKPLQWIAETVEGTFPTSGTLTTVPFSNLEFTIDGQHVDVAQVGPEDFLTSIKGVPVEEFRITGPMLDTDLVKWLVNAQNFGTPTGTISESRSFLTSIYLNGTENYLKFTGVKPKSGSIKMERGKPHELSIEFVCMDIADPTTSAPTGVTISSTFPTGTPYHHKSGASVSWNGSTIPARSITLNINRSTSAEEVLDSYTPYTVLPHMRDMTANISGMWLGNTLLTDYNSDTARQAIFTLTSTGPKTITCATAKLLKSNIPIDAGDTEAVPQNWDMRLFSAVAT